MRKKIIIAGFVGVFLLWSGSAYADSGRTLILPTGSVLDFGIGIMKGMVSGHDAALKRYMSGFGFPSWHRDLIQNENSGLYGATFDDGTSRDIRQQDSSQISPLSRFGWDNPLDKKEKWEIVVDMGVAVQIPPEVEMMTNGQLVNSWSDEALLSEDMQLGGQTANFPYYPVLTFGLKYHF